MVHGPCGGVTTTGACEVDPRPCPFVDAATVTWRGPDPDPGVVAQPGAAAMRALLATRPVVVVDLPAAPLSPASIREVGAILTGRVDAVLAGDAGDARVQLPPAYRAHLLREAGLVTWTGFNNRDRNRVALEGELAALADVGVAGVHCVTGDHTRTGDRPDAAPVFDLDSTQTAALARRHGHLVSVGESPAAPPTGRRAARLAEKERAGAEVCFVNHCGGLEPIRAFAAEARDLGVGVGFVPCVPIVLDARSAALLASFTTSPMPPGYAERILAARDPRAEGIALAVQLCQDLLALGADLGLVGVDLSGGPGPGQKAWYAEAVGEIADRVLA
ncbi:methylenetetrahydrofolate reductase [Nocardioides sp. GY 10127]|nr:methylenetetrahydrofolate reductase [Nocardioides sp. GY 10127]